MFHAEKLGRPGVFYDVMMTQRTQFMTPWQKQHVASACGFICDRVQAQRSHCKTQIKPRDMVASSPVSPIFSTQARKEGETGIQNHVSDVGPYTRIGSVANCVGEDDFGALWFNASEKEGYTSVSEGRTILISLGEPCFINQRCQIVEVDALPGRVVLARQDSS